MTQLGLPHQQAAVYLALAAASLLLAFRLIKKAIEPIDALVRAVVAAALAILAVAGFLVMLAAAALAAAH
jgi:hypothetical protein